MFNILYNSRYNENYDVPEDFDDIITKYISSLPDKTILTEDELVNKLNDESKHNQLFLQHEPEETVT
jgi:hypothetical protein